MEFGKVGVELELAVVRKVKNVYTTEDLVDVYSVVKNGIESRYGFVKTDAGKHQLEISLYPVDIAQIKEIPNMILYELENIRKMLGDVEFVFEGVLNLEDNIDIWTLWAPKERYQCLFSYLKRKSPKWYLVKNAVIYNALHIHIETKDVFNENIILNGNYELLDVLINRGWASIERITWWQRGWAPIERILPSKDTDLKKYYEQIEPIDGLPKENTVWWYVRPRPDLQTIEFRILDTVNPENIVERINFLLEWIRTK